jgi:hypothetical protein
MSELSIRHMPIVRFTKRSLLGFGRVRDDAGLVVTRVLDILDCNAALTFNRRVPDDLVSAGSLIRARRGRRAASIVSLGTATVSTAGSPSAAAAGAFSARRSTAGSLALPLDELAAATITAVVDVSAAPIAVPSSQAQDGIPSETKASTASVPLQILTCMRRLQRLCDAVSVLGWRLAATLYSLVKDCVEFHCSCLACSQETSKTRTR